MIRSILVCIAVAGSVLAGCADTTDTSDPPSGTSSTTALSSTTTSDPSVTTTTTLPQDDSGNDSQAEPEPVSGPTAGSTWMAVGVDRDDVLNVRTAPGVANDIVGRLDPIEEAVIVTGDAVLVDDAIWWEVTAPVPGWVSATYLATAGSTDDITSRIVDLYGAIPSAMTVEDLGMIVVDVRGGEGSVFVVVGAPEVGAANAEIVIDLFIVGDDAVRGERLRVFGQRLDDAGPYGLHAVESTTLCWRAADASGLCV